MYTCTYTYTRIHVHTYIRDTYARTHMHTYTHTYIHTYIHTCLLLLISMLWHRQAIFESKGYKLSSSAECRIRTRKSHIKTPIRQQTECPLTNLTHDAGNGLKDPTPPNSTLRRSGHPYPHNKIQWEYNGLRGDNSGPFKDQQASASNPVMFTAVWLSHLALAI